MTSVFSIVSFPIREFGLKRSPLVFDHFERALDFLNLFNTQILFTTHAIQNSSDSAKYGHSLQRLIRKKQKTKKGLLVEETRKNPEPCSSVEKVTSIHFKNLELFRM